MGWLRTQRRCRCTVGHHDPLRRGAPQRPRHGVRGARSHPRQGRLGDDLHRPEQAPISQGEYFVALCPEHAAACAADGWTRDDVAAYLFNQARMRVSELKRAFGLRAWAPWMQRLSDDDLVPMTEAAANIKVVVIGGAGKHSSVIPSWGMTRSVTLPVEP